jgi:hypothetical protein
MPDKISVSTLLIRALVTSVYRIFCCLPGTDYPGILTDNTLRIIKILPGPFRILSGREEFTGFLEKGNRSHQ